MISYIVSTYNRPSQLVCCLGSLLSQTNNNHEIIVCDNSNADGVWDNTEIINTMEAILGEPIHHIFTGEAPQTCYHGLEVNPRGDWLCFPSDDSYYVPKFAEIMLDHATRFSCDFVYCDMVYDPRYAEANTGAVNCYSVMNTSMNLGCIDKTCFMIKTDLFRKLGGWPPHESDWRDGALAKAVRESGAAYGKPGAGPMVYHN